MQKLQKNNRLKAYRKHIIYWLMIIIPVILALLLINLSSALNFDNTKKVSKEINNKYPTIEIVNSFGMGSTIAKYKLIKNTDACIINCYAEGSAELYSNGALFDNLKFKDELSKTKNYPFTVYINSSEEYEIEIPSYREQCNKVYNSTTEKNEDVCFLVIDKISKEKKNKEVWEVYKGEVLPKGNYKWRIEGNIKIGDKIDWIVNAFGSDFDEWAWWNSSWPYKKQINITGDTHGNYSIQLNITKNIYMNSNLSDIRFINNSETGELPYWIEYNDSSNYYIWVKVPSNKTIYMYYGNPIATEKSNIKETFIYGDDFNDNSLDTGIWTEKTSVGYVTESGQNITVSGNGYAVIYTGNVSEFGVNVSGAAKFWNGLSTGVKGVGFSVCEGSSLNPCGGGSNKSVLTVSGATFGLRNSGAFTTNGFTIDESHYSIYEIRRLDTYSQAKSGTGKNISSMNANDFINSSVSYQKGNVTFAIYSEDAGLDPGAITFTDWAYVRKYILPEPSYSLEKDSYYLEEGLASYTNPTLVGSYETFLINISYLDSYYTSISAQFIYNNTVYPTTINKTSNLAKLTSSLIVPTTAKTYSFYWVLILSNGSSTTYYNTTSNNQIVNSISIDNCDTYKNLTYNFTLFDEDNQNLINLTVYNSTIEVYLTFSSIGNTVNSLAIFNKTFLNNTAKVCLQNLKNDTRYRVDGVVRYTSDNYANEYYNIQDFEININNTPQNVNLYDLLTTRNQEFLITYKDNTFNPLADALIYVTRNYIGEGVFKTVEVPRTDQDGKTIANLVQSDIIYTFLIIKDGIIKGTFSNVRAVCQNTAIGECNINLYSYESNINPTDYSTSENLAFLFDFNSTTRLVSSAFLTLDSSVSSIVLNVTNSNNTLLCSNSLVSSSGTVSCTVPLTFQNGTIIVRLYKDNNFVSWTTFSIKEQTSEVFNGTRMFLILLLFLTLIPIGLSSGKTTIIFVFIGFFIAGILNLIEMGNWIGYGSTFLWLIIAGGILFFIKKD